MQLIEESAFRHQKMKRDALKLIYQKNPNSEANKSLPTMEQYYEDKIMVYDKFGKYQNLYPSDDQKTKKQ